MKQDNRIRLSYSTVSSYFEMPHTWINKTNGLDTKDLPIFAEGKEVHRVIVNHLKGTEINTKIAEREKEEPDFKMQRFAVYEEKDFDPRTKIEFDINDDYYVVGWVDQMDEKAGKIGDIKAYNKGFSASMLRDSFQWKTYAIPLTWLKRVFYTSASRDMDDPRWAYTIKTTEVEVKEIHREQAKAWFRKFIASIESNEYLEDCVLKPRGRTCLYIGCPYCE